MTQYPRQPLKHLAAVSVSNVDKKTVEGDHPVRLVNYTDVYYGDRITPKLPLMEATATTQQREAFRVRPGDTAITKDSETADDIGIAAFIEESAPDLVLGYHLALLRPRRSIIDPRFLYWSMCSDLARGQLSTGATGVTRFGLRQDVIASVALPTPALATQRAIADFLDTETSRIDALIAKKRSMIDLLKDHFAERVRRAVLLEATYPDPLQVSRGDTQLPGVRAMRLAWMAAFGSGTTPEAGSERYYGGSVPWVLTGDLCDGEVRQTTRSITEEALADYSALKIHPAGSLVVAMYGATIGKMGVLGIAAAVNQACCVIAPGPDLYTDFLYLYLFGFRKEVIERGRGSGQPNISQEILRSLRLAVPPVDKQRAVVAALRLSCDRVQQATTALTAQISLLREHRQALITAAVTGELEVPGVAA